MPNICALLILSIFVSLTLAQVTRRFPTDFLWGVGSSSYQIEGGWDAHGKGESIWDHLTHHYPEKMPDLSNGDVSADSYHQWRRDVQMVHELGVKTYRFSIAWTRILPTGHVNNVNKHGIRYYNNLINELLKYNITPMATIYHWDLPQPLQELGGWTNSEIIHTFYDYAKVLFEQFGDRVKIWTTFNEPWHVCEHGYGVDYMAPAYNYPGIPSYLCGHNLLKAHAEVVHLYRHRFQPTQKGIIGITSDTSYPQAATDSDEDKAASEQALQFYVGWFAHPIFSKTGDYPKVMKERIAALSKEQGFSKSRLPHFSEREIERIKGTSDFFGINSYTTVLVTKNGHNNTASHPIPSFSHDMGTIESANEAWPKSGSVWLRVVPDGMYKLLRWIKKEYDNPPVYVTENGVSDKGGLNDYARIEYFNQYLEAVLDAIEDGCDVRGYIAWSLMDSFEWRAGYTEKFGLYHVNFSHPDKIRTPKLSAKAYANIVTTNRIDWNFKPLPQPEVMAAAMAQRDDTLHHQHSSGCKARQSSSVIGTVMIIALAAYRHQ